MLELVERDPPVARPRARALQIDLAPIAEAVERALHGEVGAERIDAVLRELLDTEFGDARVTAYLPIFLQRWACERLRAEQRVEH
jgi:hypothetical protein